MLREAPVDAKAEPRRVSAESLPQKPTVAQNSEDRVRNKISGDTDDQFAAPPPPADGAREPHPAKRALVEENAIAGTAKKEVPRSDVERKPTVPHPTPAPVAAEAPPQKRSQTPSAPAAYDTPATAAAPPEAEAEARPYAKAPSQPAASGLFEASKADKADGVLGLGAAGDSASVPTQVTLSREQGGRVRAVVSNDIVTAGTVLNVTTTGGAYVTVVGIRRDGAPHVYGQSAAKQGVGTVAVRLRPASSRVTEAIFVIVGDSAPNIGPNVVTGAKDAAQLPIRLAVPGTQRRYVIVVAAELSE